MKQKEIKEYISNCKIDIRNVNAVLSCLTNFKDIPIPVLNFAVAEATRRLNNVLSDLDTLNHFSDVMVD